MEHSQPPKLPSTWSGWGLALGTRLHRSPLIAGVFWGGGSLYYRAAESWSPLPTRFSSLSPKHTKMDSKKEQATEIALCGWRALGRRELRVDPQQLNRAESRFSGERPKTLDPEMLESSVSPPSGELCPFVSHGHLDSSPSKEHAAPWGNPQSPPLTHSFAPWSLLPSMPLSSEPSPSHAFRHPDT